MIFHPDKAEHFSSYPDRCLFGTAPTLTDLRMAYEGKADMQWMIVQLSTFQEKVNVDKKMTSYQLETCAQTISQDFGYLKATEIMLFLSRLQGGAYMVDWFGAITPDKIILALREKFMPWRNNRYYQYEQQERERKAAEEMARPTVTFDEWKRMKEERGEEVNNKTNPLNYGK